MRLELALEPSSMLYMEKRNTRGILFQATKGPDSATEMEPLAVSNK